MGGRVEFLIFNCEWLINMVPYFMHMNCFILILLITINSPYRDSGNNLPG